MSYLLNSVNLSTYGILPGHAPSSNISLQGCFNLPSRTGKTYHDWMDSDLIEPFVDAGDIFFAGRNIVFTGTIFGANAIINNNLQNFYNIINAATGLSIFETPYCNASGYIKSVIPEYINGACSLVMTFREPVVILTGTLPASGISNYSIDNIPFSSFGLYLSKAEALHDLPELKEQLYTIYGSEGYQITKRKNKTFDFNGFITGTSLVDFKSKISALYKLFSSSGTRNIKINDEIYIECFATEGFKIENIYLYDNLMIANFNISLMIVNVIYINYLLTEADEYILTEADEYIFV